MTSMDYIHGVSDLNLRTDDNYSLIHSILMMVVVG